jgi:isopropylmalate/homocitrate/citramalate synthase
MKKYIVELEGTSPLVFNTRSQELDEERAKLKRDELAEWEQKNWRRKAERDKKGNVIIPIRWLKSAFVNACTHSKIVPNFATSKRETYTRYAKAMYFDNSSFKCSEKDLEKREAFMGAQGKNSSTSVLKVYPSIKEWKTTIEVADGIGRMTIEELKEIFTFAGIIEGIGDFRVVNAGRFEVISIKEKK